MAASNPPRSLNLSSLPPIFVLPYRLSKEELHEKQDLIFRSKGTLTYDAAESRLFIGRVGQKNRAAFELRTLDIWTEEAPLPEDHASDKGRSETGDDGPVRKRAKTEVDARRLRRSTRQTEHHSSPISISSGDESTHSAVDESPSPDVSWPDLSHNVLVLSTSWLDECLTRDKLVPFKPHVVYAAKIVSRPPSPTSPTSDRSTTKRTTRSTVQPSSPTKPTTSILERAKADAAALPPSSSTPGYPSRRRFGGGSTSPTSSAKPRPPKLQRATTSEYQELADHPLPPLPDWASGPYASYACCRPTPMDSPNAAFIAQLSKIKEARVLRLDEIGVRAYSTSIASLSAYRHHIRHTEEILRLPGCEAKIAALWKEWDESAEEDSERFIQTVRDLDNDVDLHHLRLFWNIWGVGPDTARKFYFDNGWRELDDVVEFGWSSLTRVQQIGVKYYDEFLEKIPRAEVELIRDVVLRHARTVLDIPEASFGTSDDVDCVIVGGYRRGKEFSGDVDVVLSHRDEDKTKDLVGDVVGSLEEEGWITHTLTLHTTTSDRGQATLPFRAKGHGGHGFDSLDKALCVWQDPNFEDDGDENAEEEDSEKPRKKNPNIHRRVDIIISAWRTVGCAILGWSGGTTFQRDIRRYVSKVHNLKFDSSGVRNRGNGHVLDLEGPRPRDNAEAVKMLLRGEKIDRADERWKDMEWDEADTWEDRERRLMEGLGIGYRPATERCTG